MFEIFGLEATKTKRGAPLWKFNVRFTLAGNLGSAVTYAWRYDPANDKLFKPSSPGSYAKMASADSAIIVAIKAEVRRFILYRDADISVAIIGHKLRQILSESTPREAYEQLKADYPDDNLSPGQWVLLTSLGVLSDYLNLLPERNPEPPLEDDDA